MKHLGKILLLIIVVDIYATELPEGITEEEWKENFGYLDDPSLGFPTKIAEFKNDGLKKQAYICPMKGDKELIIKDKRNGISISLSTYDRIFYIDKVLENEVEIIQIYRGWDRDGSTLEHKTKLDIEGNLYIPKEVLCSAQELS